MNERPSNPALLSISHATVVKSGKYVLDDLSLEIRAGQNTAVIGPNGSGKSSLIKLLTRQYYPLARPDGEPTVTILGKDRWDVFELRSNLGIVSADLHGDFLEESEMTGYEVAVSGFFSSRGIAPHHTVTAEMREKANDALKRMGAGHLAGRSIGEMSTGESRRCLIARALVSNPLALVLDEPTTGLDMAAQQRFLETVRRLAQRGATIVLVTHHIEEIIPEIDHIVILNAGKVQADGAKEEVLTAQNLSQAYGARIELRRRGKFYSAHVEP